MNFTNGIMDLGATPDQLREHACIGCALRIQRTAVENIRDAAGDMDDAAIESLHLTIARQLDMYATRRVAAGADPVVVQAEVQSALFASGVTQLRNVNTECHPLLLGVTQVVYQRIMAMSAAGRAVKDIEPGDMAIAEALQSGITGLDKVIPYEVVQEMITGTEDKSFDPMVLRDEMRDAAMEPGGDKARAVVQKLIDKAFVLGGPAWTTGSKLIAKIAGTLGVDVPAPTAGLIEGSEAKEAKVDGLSAIARRELAAKLGTGDSIEEIVAAGDDDGSGIVVIKAADGTMGGIAIEKGANVTMDQVRAKLAATFPDISPEQVEEVLGTVGHVIQDYIKPTPRNLH
jgi:hypothetical protein